MKVSTKGRYALRMMADLAQTETDTNTTIRDISTRQGISIKYMEQIMSNLSKAGLVHSERGAQGGYRLGRPPKEYTVGEILRATEGSLAPVSCLEDESHSCQQYGECTTRCFWSALYDKINQYVNNITLQDLIDEDMAL